MSPPPPSRPGRLPYRSVGPLGQRRNELRRAQEFVQAFGGNTFLNAYSRQLRAISGEIWAIALGARLPHSVFAAIIRMALSSNRIPAQLTCSV